MCARDWNQPYPKSSASCLRRKNESLEVDLFQYRSSDPRLCRVWHFCALCIGPGSKRSDETRPRHWSVCRSLQWLDSHHKGWTWRSTPHLSAQKATSSVTSAACLTDFASPRDCFTRPRLLAFFDYFINFNPGFSKRKKIGIWFILTILCNNGISFWWVAKPDPALYRGEQTVGERVRRWACLLQGLPQEAPLLQR